MAFCPVCRSEYRAGFTVCKNCGDVPLVAALVAKAALTEEEAHAGHAVGFTDVESPNTVEVDGRRIDPTRIFPLDRAADLKELLDQADIPSAILPLEGVQFADQVARFEVRVREKDFERAQAVLHDVWKKDLEAEGAEGSDAVSADQCPACGAVVPLDVEECPECGLVVGVGEEEAEGAEA